MNNKNLLKLVAKAAIFGSALVVLSTPKTFAQPSVQMANVLRRLGWMQATCTFYKLGFMSKENAQMALTVALEGIEKEANKPSADLVKKQTLEQYLLAQ